MQEVTGVDEGAWPDTRPASVRRRPASGGGSRRWWGWIAGGLLVALVGVVAWVQLRPSGSSQTCGRFSGTAVDYTSGAGYPTQAEAVSQFLASKPGQDLPRTGFAPPTAADRQQTATAKSVVTVSEDEPQYVHHRDGRVDVVLTLEGSGGSWVVAEVNACA